MIPEEAYSAWDGKRKAATPKPHGTRGLRVQGGAPGAGGRVGAAPEASCRKALRRPRSTPIVAAHTKAETVATRKASQLALEAFTKALPEMLGGSADLTGSNLTNTASTPPLRIDADGSPTAGATSTTACASSAWPR